MAEARFRTIKQGIFMISSVASVLTADWLCFLNLRGVSFMASAEEIPMSCRAIPTDAWYLV
jgi:hypothetical protein